MKSKVDTVKSANSPEGKNQSPLETLQQLGADTSPQDGVQSGNKTFGVSEERLADLFENAPIGIYLSTERRLLRANRELTRMFGYASEAEAVASVPDASEFFVDPAQRRRIVERAKNSPSYIVEEVLYRRKNGSAFIANLRMRAVCDASGAVTVLEGFVEDITERKRLEQEIRQAQKMEVIGQLAGGVAHDFNNILAATLMHLGLLLRGPEMSSGVRNTLREIEDEIMRAANLTRQLLLFSRRQRVQFRPVHINALINDFLKMLRRVLGENIELNFEQGASLPMVKVDSGMIEQVIMNLCVNARDAMPKGGKLKLTTGLRNRTCDDASVQPEARTGRFVYLSVSDTGCGMNQEVLKHLFEPFFTTKEVGKGTGLGLATVFGIVKQHAGWVDVESVIGKGSCFRIYLPVLLEAADHTASKSDSEQVGGGSETILLVEDEVSVRRMSALCLRKLGYGVLVASNGAEALKLWEQHRETIELLLTDVVMPGSMSGLDLAERLKSEKENLQVILCSGYTGEMDQDRLNQQQAAFLDKPYNPATLARIVRSSLDKGTGSAGAPDSFGDL